jgi:hypothetical protein
MKRILLFLTGLLLVVVAAGIALAFLERTGKAVLLVLDRHAAVEANGVPVPGEMLVGTATAIVTRRDPGKEHSYLLFFAGDVDSKGDMGDVVDCHKWVAPHLPVLLVTRDYPPCVAISGDGAGSRRRPLMVQVAGGMQFVAEDQSIIRVRIRR